MAEVREVATVHELHPLGACPIRTHIIHHGFRRRNAWNAAVGTLAFPVPGFPNSDTRTLPGRGYVALYTLKRHYGTGAWFTLVCVYTRDPHTGAVQYRKGHEDAQRRASFYTSFGV